MIGLASSAFARHYSRNHCCFLFLWVLRCFTSPRSLTPPYTFRRESPGRKTPGGVSPFGHPRITARLSAPRGLSQISTSFFGSRCQGIHRLLLETYRPQRKIAITRTTPTNRPAPYADLRCSRPLCSSQHTIGTNQATSNRQRPISPNEGPSRPNPEPPQPWQPGSPVPQDPTTCTSRHQPPDPFPTPSEEDAVLDPGNQSRLHCQCSTHEQPSNTLGSKRRLDTNPPPNGQQTMPVLLRKEVIQPHLPVRLPCYDLVLITDPTFDGSFHKG